MGADTDTKPKSDVTRGIIRRGLQLVATFVLIGVILFVSAGRPDWLWGWIYVGAMVGILVFNAIVLLSRDPQMVAERGRVKHEQTRRWDTWVIRLITVPTFGALIVAGLDERWGWSPEYPAAVHIIALVVFTAGELFLTWAMASNKFFEQTVRIQTERQHTVAAGGPYRFVRHPGYVGMMIAWLATPILLDSLWALIPAGLVVVGYVIRTALEDQTLQAELPGYKEYAQQTRYRLLPGVW